MPNDSQYITAPITVHLDAKSDTAVIEVGDARVLIQEGEWSDWVELSFDMAPMGLMPVPADV